MSNTPHPHELAGFAPGRFFSFSPAARGVPPLEDDVSDVTLRLHPKTPWLVPELDLEQQWREPKLDLS